MNVLGIETSCDETAVAIVNEGKIIAEVIASQIDLHSLYGGVVPELASREHLKRINLILEDCLKKAGMEFNEIDGIAVTAKPGLEGSLIVGMMVARTIAFITKKPLIEVDHLESHLFASKFTGISEPPGMGLIISGGHTRLVYIKKWGDYEIIGNTCDDAVGECFDKVASILGLEYPGGPAIEKRARDGYDSMFRFPVSKMKNPYDFSYSGLKTAVLYKIKYDLENKLDDELINNISSSFQVAAFKPLIENTFKAILEYNPNWVFVCGGVAANSTLREMFSKDAEKKSINTDIVFPPKALCTDNASMVAACGEFYLTHDK